MSTLVVFVVALLGLQCVLPAVHARVHRCVVTTTPSGASHHAPTPPADDDRPGHCHLCLSLALTRTALPDAAPIIVPGWSLDPIATPIAVVSIPLETRPAGVLGARGPPSA